MRSNAARLALGIAAIAVAVVLLVVLKDDGGDTGDRQTTTGARESKPAPTSTDGTTAKSKPAPKEPTVPTIVVRNGKPVGGVRDLAFDAGEQVRFAVRSDVADEVHVHGYDIGMEVPAGGVATLSFRADIEGLFEVELHESEEQIAELRVNP